MIVESLRSEAAAALSLIRFITLLQSWWGLRHVCTAEVPSAATFRQIIAKLRVQDYSADVEKDVTALKRILGIG